MRAAATAVACLATALLTAACVPPPVATREAPPATPRYVTTTRAPTTTAVLATTTTTTTTTTKATTTTTVPDRCAEGGDGGGSAVFVGLEVSVDTYGGTERWFIQKGRYTFRAGGEEIRVPVAAAWTCPDGETRMDICAVPPEDRSRLIKPQPVEIVREAQRAVGAADDGIWGSRSGAALDDFCAAQREEEAADKPPEPTTTTTTTTRPRPTTTARRVVSSGTISDWHIRLLSVNSNANSAIRNENMFNPDPPAGGKFALMRVEVRYLGDGKESTAFDVNFAAIDQRGNAYGSCGRFIVIPNEYDAYTEHFSGASQTGNLCFEVPSSVSDLRLRVSDAGLFADDKIVLEAR